jgi:hypothetical protein
LFRVKIHQRMDYLQMHDDSAFLADVTTAALEVVIGG